MDFGTSVAQCKYCPICEPIDGDRRTRRRLRHIRITQGPRVDHPAREGRFEILRRGRSGTSRGRSPVLAFLDLSIYADPSEYTRVLVAITVAHSVSGTRARRIARLLDCCCWGKRRRLSGEANNASASDRVELLSRQVETARFDELSVVCRSVLLPSSWQELTASPNDFPSPTHVDTHASVAIRSLPRYVMVRNCLSKCRHTSRTCKKQV